VCVYSFFFPFDSPLNFPQSVTTTAEILNQKKQIFRLKKIFTQKILQQLLLFQMSTTMRPTLQTVPESLPADHVTQPAQTTPLTPNAVSSSSASEKAHPTTVTSSGQTGTTAVSLKPRGSTSSRVSFLLFL
jgi:hypothetical protein